jgi:glycosyltransferase involved in cell wall biosynthesis
VKLLIVSQHFWPESFRINDISKTLVEKGVEVMVMTGKPNYPKGKIFDGYRAGGCVVESFNGATVNRIPLVERKNGGLRLAINYLCFILSGLVYGPWLLREKKFDVVFVYGTSPILQAIPALFLGWLRKKPVVVWVQDLWPDSVSATGYIKNKLILKIIGCVVRFIYRHSDLLLTQSRAFIGPVGEMASGTPVRYYPNSVDGSFAAPSRGGGVAISGMDSGFRVVFAGNIGSAQAVEVIVEAAARLQSNPGIRLIVVGDGSRWAWMAQQKESQNLDNLYLPGRLPVEDMPDLMQNASALLVTLSDQPIFAATVPNKVQAYMAAGRPIIACLNGEGARLVLEAGAGLAVPSEDAEGLARAILQLYGQSEAEREQMGQNGRAYYQQHFDHDKLVDELIEHLASVTGSMA